jgi:putative transposase
MMTPEMVHCGQAEDIRAKRQRVLAQAYAANPERFVRGKPMPPELPGAVWINPPAREAQNRGEVVDIECEQQEVA